MPATVGTVQLPAHWGTFQRAVLIARGLNQPDPAIRARGDRLLPQAVDGCASAHSGSSGIKRSLEGVRTIQVGWKTGVVSLRTPQGGLSTEIRREPHLAALGGRLQRGPLFNFVEQREAILTLGP